MAAPPRSLPSTLLGRLFMAVVALQIPFAVVPDPAVPREQQDASSVVGLSPLELVGAHIYRAGRDKGGVSAEGAKVFASALVYPGAVGKAAWKYMHCSYNGVDADAKTRPKATDDVAPATDEFDEFEKSLDADENREPQEVDEEAAKKKRQQFGMARAIASGSLLHVRCDTPEDLDFKLPSPEEIEMLLGNDEYWDATLSFFGERSKEFLCGCFLVFAGCVMQLFLNSKLAFGGMALIAYAAHKAPAAEMTPHVFPAILCAAAQLHIFDALARGGRARGAATAAAAAQRVEAPAANAASASAVAKEGDDGTAAKKSSARRRKA